MKFFIVRTEIFQFIVMIYGTETLKIILTQKTRYIHVDFCFFSQTNWAKYYIDSRLGDSSRLASQLSTLLRATPSCRPASRFIGD
jgi:hypothetical protein